MAGRLIEHPFSITGLHVGMLDLKEKHFTLITPFEDEQSDLGKCWFAMLSTLMLYCIHAIDPAEVATSADLHFQPIFSDGYRGCL